ncbi:putative RTA1 domain protein [Pseudovirgaria hyperparasitica]|uniref:Putative RTA1 domain protein n=1 Tax=Pseudovirgaria hyperparasitica TaxID=470096 RepID=A0A6A6WF24_9PEZI|nr:putative RTA1 domain protein [Pseudovirgaria hyperparasitica]KAF2760759.1 putative RTA1 domain protein [Pseudovirgaria hyperparasitica]
MSDSITLPSGQVITDLDQCTLDICPIDIARFHYLPNVAGNVFFCIVFGVCLLLQLFFGIKHKTWGYMVAMVFGLVLELLGYVGRLLLHNNPFLFDNFLLYLICLTIGPAFLSAAIYLCLGRIIVIYSPALSRLKPRTYTVLFVSCDLLSLVLQALGGALASTADDEKSNDLGINIMIAGLVAQVVSLLVFMLLCADFAWSAHKRRSERDPAFAVLRSSFIWKAFLIGLGVATLTIFVRSVYRVAELFEGFDSELANNEPLFMALEGTMISIAVICLTGLHPGVAFKGNYAAGDFKFRTKKGKKDVESDANSDAQSQNVELR